MQNKVTTVDHPLVQHKLTIMRDKNTALPDFRGLLREISLLLAYEVTRHLKLKTVSVETPVAGAELPMLDEPEPCFITILRAGNGLLDGMLDLIPAASVGHVGLSAIEPALHLLGRTCAALPTTLLANHPGFTLQKYASTQPYKDPQTLKRPHGEATQNRQVTVAAAEQYQVLQDRVRGSRLHRRGSAAPETGGIQGFIIGP